MIPIQSTFTDRELDFGSFQSYLESYQFTLGGNWEYDHGSFDRALDGEAQKVWLRIPFAATHGRIDSEKEYSGSFIRIGSPYVLKHVYNEGNDPEASYRTYGAMMDQFQTPLDKDAEVDAKWVDQAKRILSEVEQSYNH